MADRLYPLLMKPGIKRDGTPFQGEYCTDGQWMRFQRGRPKKMGGYVALPYITYSTTHNTILNLMIFSSLGQTYYAVYHGELTKGSGYVDIYANGEVFMQMGGSPKFALFEGPVSYNGTPHFLTQRVQDFNDINSNVESDLYIFPLNKGGNIPFNAVSLNITDANDQRINLNGGMRLVPPFLFVWGMNGAVAWSSSSNIKDFTIKENTNTPGSLSISNDKVIQGYPLRAGAQSPAILFWTLSSLVRLLNVSPDSYDFKTDVISKNVSILSRLSVVEYDGLFLWPGTDRFFVYNGTVQEVPNTLNLNYFFDNVDMTRRQQVVGVRNQKYGEIWWFYCDKRDSKPYNTRAVIYNKRENTWYDTKINRDAAWYDDATGVMFAAGKAKDTDTVWQVWQHEQGTAGQDYQQKVFPIPASLQTPVISWAAVGPEKEEMGLDRQIQFKRLEPDFILNKGVPDGNAPSLKVDLISRLYAQSVPTTTSIGTIEGVLDATPATEKLTQAVTGRQMSFVFSSEDDFEMGQPLVKFGVGGVQ